MSWQHKKQSHQRLQPFEILFEAIFFLVVVFIGWNLWVVVKGGACYLKQALLSPELRFSIGLSLWTSTISTLICMILAIPCAYVIVMRESKWTKIGEAVLGLPLSLPYLVLGLCLLTAFSTPFGKLLKELGLRVVFHPRGIILAHILVNLPFVIRLITEAFRRLDPELALTAQTLGASRFQAMWYITLPLCKVDCITALILAWSRGMGEFGATLMLVGVTRMKTETLPGNIYLNISTGDNNAALAAALILLLLSLFAQFIGWLVTRRRDYL